MRSAGERLAGSEAETLPREELPTFLPRIAGDASSFGVDLLVVREAQLEKSRHTTDLSLGSG